MSERGGRTDEYLDAMHALRTEPAPSFHGRYVSFDAVEPTPGQCNSDGSTAS